MDSPAQNTGRSVFEQYTSPLYVMAKPAGAACNLDCKYCYYNEKKRLYTNRSASGDSMMSDDTLEAFVKGYIEAQSTPEVLFTWHGGEPMLRPLSFYQKAMRLQKYYGWGRQIDNCIQTNGTLLTDEWCEFLKENHWLVGLSIDGDATVHDLYRKDHQGRDTHSRVMRAIEMLNRYGVEWNAMAVVNSANVRHPREFYQFFKSIDCRYIQFTPIVERVHHHIDGRHLATPDEKGYKMTAESVTPRQWGEFLCEIFDQWVKTDVGEYFIQIFDATLANWVGVSPGLCTMDRICGHAGVMEYNGDVYSCDHYVFPGYLLGNIHSKTLTEMMHSERQHAFGMAKLSGLPAQCTRCQYLRLCNGECPKNRFVTTADGENGLNYLCEGYRMYFNHTAPYMRFMRDEYRAGRPASNVMKKSGAF